MSFPEIFGRDPSVSADAPGRVNLIGEHTDYSGGFVLPLAIPQRCEAEIAVRGDRTVRAWSRNLEKEGVAEYGLGNEKAGRGWLDYVQGLTQAAAASGHALSGFELAVSSEVPLGAGLGSSAALEISVLRALREAFRWTADDVELARLGRKAENELVGAPVGIMDQMASSLAGERDALFLDTRSLEHRSVPIPSACEFAVVDSGVTHSHARGDYRTRRAECDEAARLLGVSELRDLLGRDVDEVVRALPPPLDRRVRHVLTENARVLAAVEAFGRADLRRIGELLLASHRSLRDDFEVSTPELDRLVELAIAEPGCVGARLTGGGFGGSVLIAAQRGRARSVADNAAKRYAAEVPRTPRVLLPT